MTDRIRSLTRSARAASLAALLPFAAACDDDPTEPPATPMEEIAVVLNSVDVSLTVFPVDDPTDATTIGLGPDGSPVTLAARGGVAIVPLGFVPAVAIVDLVAGTVERTVALPEGSGATGAAFLNDSIAVVANPSLNSISRINVRSGQRLGEVAVGTYPQAIVAVQDTAYVLNAELGPDFSPTGPGTVSVVAGSPLQVVRTITLGGTNPGGGAAIAGRVYVLNSGGFGAADGSLSVIDRGSLAEVEHHAGFGEFPGAVAADGDGLVYVGGFGLGLLVWDADAEAFLRGPGDPITPGGLRSVSGAGVDEEGRAWTLRGECAGPAKAYRLNDAFGVAAEADVGTCPIGIVFTSVPDPDA